MHCKSLRVKKHMEHQYQVHYFKCNDLEAGHCHSCGSQFHYRNSHYKVKNALSVMISTFVTYVSSKGFINITGNILFDVPIQEYLTV